MKRYSDYKDSGIEWIGEIPSHWGVKKLKYITICLDSKRVPLSAEQRGDKQGEYPYWGANSIVDYVNDYTVDEEVVLIGEDGAPFFDSYKDVAFYSNEKIWVNNHIHVLRATKINTKILTYILNSVDYKNHITGSTRDKLTQGDMNNISVALPSNEEQHKIISYLDKKTSQIETLISKKEDLIETLKDSRTKLISETITKGLDKNVPMKDSGIEWIGKVPKHYKIKKLRYLGSLQNGISKGAEEFGFGYPFVSYGDVYKNTISNEVEGLVNSSEEDRRIYSVIEGDVFFTRTSETIEEIGFSSTCLETIPDATFAGFLIRFRPNTNDLYKGYSKYYFRSDIHRKFFVKEMNLVTRASLGQNLLKNLPVVIPSYEEQIEISKYLDNKVTIINNSISKIEKQIDVLKKAKQKLITEVVTGKIDVTNL